MTWTEVPLRRIFRLVNGGTPKSEEQYWNGDVPWATPVDVGAVDGKYLTSTERTLTEEGVLTGSRTVPGNALVLSTRAPIGYVAQTRTKMAFNQGCRGLVATVPVDIRYFRYQLLALREELISRGAGSTFMELSADTLAAVPLMRPPVDEQRRIADFLDAETARIDHIIAIRQQQSTLHAQRFMQLIDGVVAGDNDALAEIGYSKGSGAWDAGKVSRLFAVIPGFAFPSEKFVQVGNGTRLLRGINVAPGRIDWEVETVAWDLESSPVDRRFHLRLDDLVVGMDRPWITGGTRIALVRQDDLPSLLLQRVACIRSRSTSTARYLRWVLGSSHFQVALESETTGVSVPHISGDQINAFTYHLPAPEEQAVLAALLQNHSDAQVLQKELVNQQLVAIAERRQALINAAVTGQIDITTAQGVAV